MIDLKKIDLELEQLGFLIEKINRVRDLIAGSEFKRIMPPIAPL